MPERISTDLVIKVLVGEQGVRQRGIAVGNLKTNAVPFFKSVSAGHDLYFVGIDLSRYNGLRIRMGIEGTVFRAVFLVLLSMRGTHPSLGNDYGYRLQAFFSFLLGLRMLVGEFYYEIRVRVCGRYL